MGSWQSKKPFVVVQQASYYESWSSLICYTDLICTCWLWSRFIDFLILWFLSFHTCRSALISTSENFFFSHLKTECSSFFASLHMVSEELLNCLFRHSQVTSAIYDWLTRTLLKLESSAVFIVIFGHLQGMIRLFLFFRFYDHSRNFYGDKQFYQGFFSFVKISGGTS